MKSDDGYDWPMGDLNKSPFAHQKETAKFLLSNKRAYVLSDLGTGKTLSALWAADALMQYGAIKKALIVSPLTTLQLVWGQELFINIQRRYYATAHGSADVRRRAIHSAANFVMINHDGVTNYYKDLIAAKFDLMIIDELTAYKNAMSDRSKAMRKLAITLPAVWGMTGFPTPNSPLEAYSQAKIVNPFNPHLPQYLTQFRNMVLAQPMPGVFVPTPHAADVVHAVLQPAIRFTREECLDLPPVMHQTLEVKMTPRQKGLYDQMKKELYAQYEHGEITASNAGVKLNKLLQISAGAVFDDRGEVCFCDADPKFDLIMDTFEELGRTKMIVVAAFKNVVERLCTMIREKGISCEFVHGEVKIRDRTRIVTEFQSGKLEVLVVQPESMSHGVTLTASSTIVWQSLVASGETYTQMNGRITRAGQDKKQFVKHLVCSAAEKHILKLLDGKVGLSAAILELFKNQEL